MISRQTIVAILAALLAAAAYGSFLVWAQYFEHDQGLTTGTGVLERSKDSGWPTACRIIYEEIGVLSGKVQTREVFWYDNMAWINLAVGVPLVISVGICGFLLARFVQRGMRFSLFGIIVLATAVGLAMLMEKPLTWRATGQEVPLPWYEELTHMATPWPWFFYPLVYLGLFCVAWWPLAMLCWLGRVVRGLIHTKASPHPLN